MAWLGQILASLLIKFIPWLVTKGMEWYHDKKENKQLDDDIEKRLERVKNAYKKAFNGEPITPEQREDLKRAISDFIRGGTTGGL